MVSLSKKAVAGVGGGFLIDVKTTSQYYDAKTASLYFGGLDYPYQWWSRACRGTAGSATVTDYLTLDISSLTSGMTTPVIVVHFQYEIHDFDFANDGGYGAPAICKNDNSVIVEDSLVFEKAPYYIMRAYSLIADITTEKSNKIKIRFKEYVSMHGVGTICSILKMFPFIELFDAES